MNNNLALSVVMPTYNSEKYLEKSIDSILNQTFKDFEFIIIDDGSTDKTLKTIKKYKDPRIILIQNKINKGIVYSLNKGIKLAKGKYIARMDADDISVKTRFSKQINFLENNPNISILGSWIKNFGNGNNTWKTLKEHEEIRSRMLFESSIAHPSVIFRKDDLLKNNFKYDKSFVHAEDFALWVKASEKVKVSNYQQILLKYRIHQEQTPKKHKLSQENSSWKIRKYQLNKLKIKPNKKQKAIHQQLSCWSKELSFFDFWTVGNWLRLILISNLKTKYYDQKSLIKVVGERWAGIISLRYKENPLILFFAILNPDISLYSAYFFLDKYFLDK